MRPFSLAEVALRVNLEYQDFGNSLSEFLDTFYAFKSDQDRQKSLDKAPSLIDPNTKFHEFWHNAFLGGVAEHLSSTYNLKLPDWTNNKDRMLKKAWFDNSGLESLNATLFKESPPAFKRRMIFTEKKPLRRV